jgi:hypothetical protein
MNSWHRLRVTPGAISSDAKSIFREHAATGEIATDVFKYSERLTGLFRHHQGRDASTHGGLARADV